MKITREQEYSLADQLGALYGCSLATLRTALKTAGIEVEEPHEAPHRRIAVSPDNIFVVSRKSFDAAVSAQYGGQSEALLRTLGIEVFP